MTTISAMVIADSVGLEAPRLTTMLLRYPLVIHAELMTHRVFSRNAASSRAIPIQKMIKATLDDPFIPLVWTKNQPGMQGYTELSPNEAEAAKTVWMGALTEAVRFTRRLDNMNVHKQIANRLLAPFAHITVVVSSTQWSNWFALRDHPKAEPHIKMLAQKMHVALEASKPTTLFPGEWHLPFVGERDRQRASMGHPEPIRLSVARCASTSYKTVDDFDMTQDRADKLFEGLLGEMPIHASPAEHQAKIAVNTSADDLARNGNFGEGWVQFRKTIKGERQ